MGVRSAQAEAMEEDAVKGLLTNVRNYAECVLMNRSIVNDGEGGYITTWTDGATFGAALAVDTSTEASAAQALGVRDVYSVYTDAAMTLMQGMVFRRLEDGKVFRVTSDGDEKATPTTSTLNMRMVTAEEWSIPAYDTSSAN